MVTYMNSTEATTARRSLLQELQDRTEAGENLEEVLEELKARPVWEEVAKAMNLR